MQCELRPARANACLLSEGSSQDLSLLKRPQAETWQPVCMWRRHACFSCSSSAAACAAEDRICAWAAATSC